MTMKYLSIKNILIASLIINIGLGIWIFKLYHEDPEVNIELIKSQGRVEELEKQLKKVGEEYQVLEQRQDILDRLVKAKPKERIIIKHEYDKKIDSVINLDADSSFKFLTDRLTEINID